MIMNQVGSSKDSVKTMSLISSDYEYYSLRGSGKTVTLTSTIQLTGTYLIVVHDTIDTNSGYTYTGLSGHCSIILVVDGIVKDAKSAELEGYTEDSKWKYNYYPDKNLASASISGTTITITHPWDDSSNSEGLVGMLIYKLG